MHPPNPDLSANSRAITIIAGLASTPITRPPGTTRCAMARVTTPLPQPTSSTIVPGFRSSSVRYSLRTAISSSALPRNSSLSACSFAFRAVTAAVSRHWLSAPGSIMFPSLLFLFPVLKRLSSSQAIAGLHALTTHMPRYTYHAQQRER